LRVKNPWFLFVVCSLLALHLAYTPASRAQDAEPAEEPARLPAAPLQSGSKGLPAIDRVYIDRIEIRDNTIFSDQELAAITDTYRGRELTFEDLEELRNRLNLYYLSKGFINSGVILPDQKIEDGLVTFKAIEGRITDIQIIDYERLKPSYIKKRFTLGTGPPLNLNELQERLRILESNPLIQRLNVQLDPGDQPGEANLKVKVTENKPYYLALSLNNNRSPAVGSEVVVLEAAHNNFSGHGDSIQTLFGFNEGIFDVAVNYTLPVSAKDTLFNLFYSYGDSTVVEEPFDEIDIDNEEIHYGTSISHPFINTTHSHLRIGLLLEKIDYKSYLFDRPFSFSQGVVNGESSVTVLRLLQEWLYRSSTQVTALSSVFSFGLDALGSDNNEPYTDFFTWLGQFQWTRMLAKPLAGQILFRANIQLSRDPLLPFEKFTIGGINSVRGYRKDALVRDYGVFGSLEYRHSLLNLKLPKISRAKDDGLLQFYLDFVPVAVSITFQGFFQVFQMFAKGKKESFLLLKKGQGFVGCDPVKPGEQRCIFPEPVERFKCL